jgi:hypothetical protein
LSEPVSSPRSRYPLAQLRDLADQPTREQILYGAARQLRTTTTSEIHEAIRRGLWNRIPGFRDPLLAPVPMLAQELDHFLFRHSSSTCDLVGLWAKSVDGMEASIDEFLEAASADGRLGELLEKPCDKWSGDELLQAADAYLEQSPGGHRRAVAVLLADRLWQRRRETEIEGTFGEEADMETADDAGTRAGGDAVNTARSEPSDSASNEHEMLQALRRLVGRPPDSLRTHRFAAFVNELRDLPPDAAEWNEVPAFIGAVVDARERAAERGDTVCAQIADQLRNVATCYARALQFIEYDSAVLTGGLSIGIRDAAAVQNLCNAAETVLRRLTDALDNLPTRSRLREWNEVTDALAEEVRGLLEQLARLVGITTAPPRLAGAPGEPPSVDSAEPVTAVEREPTVVWVVPEGEQAGEAIDPTATVPLEITSGELSKVRAGDKATGARTTETPVAERLGDAAVEARAPQPASLPAAVDQAPPPERTEADEALDRTFWSLVGEGRVALAYQLARVMLCPPVPVAVLRASVLGPALTEPSGEIAKALEDVLTQVASESLEERRETALLLAGATLKPGLLAARTGAAAVLRAQRLDGALYAFAQVVASYGERLKNGISVGDLSAARTAAAWEARRDQLLAEARAYLEQAPHRTIVYAPATAVWRIWLRPGGWLHDLLSTVLRNDAAAVAAVDEALGRLDLGREMRKAQKELRGSNPKAIEARALGQLRSHSDEAVQIARAWVELQRVRSAPDSYALRLIDDVRRDLERDYPTAKAEVERLARDPDGRVRQAARAFRRSLDQLRDLFSAEARPDVKELTGATLLNAELLRTNLPLSAHLEPEARPEDVRAALVCLLEEDPDWEVAYQRRVERGDLDGAWQILTLREGDEAIDRLSVDWQRRLESARDAMKRRLGEVRHGLERAMAHGLLTESERAHHDAVLVRIQRELADTRRFDVLHGRLDGIAADVKERRSARVGALRQRLEAQPVSNDVRARVEAALEAGDPLTAEEHLHLGTSSWPYVDGMKARDAFVEFFPEGLRALDRVLADRDRQPEGIVRAVREQSIEGLDLSHVPGTQSARAAEMLEAWFEAKRRRRLEDGPARAILEALGLRGQEVRAVHQGNPAYLEVRTEAVRDRNEIPVEFFGSRANGRYRLLGVWGLPSEEELLTFVGDTNAHPATLVFYFARMTEQRRRDLARLAHERRRSVVVIDETLLLFLCGERGSRLPVLFRCALPFGHLEPYITTASLVPPEMFYGRDRERDLIVDPNGPIFLYGGRQLGKTALLRHVERSYHAPQRGWVVRWLDLRAEGVGYHAAIDEVWRLIVRELKDLGAVGRLSAQPHPDRIGELVREWLNADPTRRILLLLDEADRFLAQDGKTDFPVTTKLKSLMDETGRRFKVVFAGLHNVLRTTHQSNHPLGHFGDPIAIGPLMNNGEVRAAWGLIEEPLSALGFRFAAPDLVLRILAQTNYYPSLIQLFCHHLLRHLQQNLRRAFDARQQPPYTITSNSVDEAYLSRDLQEAIQQRFALTLQLDPRYEVIAYVLAYAVLRVEATLDEGVPVKWLRQEALSWWSDGFVGTPEEHFVVLLEEMVGLGVLRRLEGGKYTFRNANTLLLLGTVEEVERALLRERSAPPVYEAAHFRETQRGKPERASPLTARQLAALREPKHGVSLLIGSAALGLEDVHAFLEQAFGPSFVRTFDGVVERGDFDRRLRELELRPPDATTFLFIGAETPWTVGWVESARARLARLKSTRALVRAVFVVTPETLLRLVEGELDALEGHDIEILTLSPWHETALQHWFEANNLPNDKTTGDRVRAVTGGRSLLLHRFIDDVPNYASWEQALNAVEVQIRQAEYRESVLAALGLSKNTGFPDQVLRAIAQWGGAIDLADLVELLPSGLAERLPALLRWAELLHLASPAGPETWQVDPFVQRLLTSD